MMSKARLILGCVLLALLALFIILNLETANIHFLAGRVQMPLAFAILFSAALGAGATLALRFLKAFRRQQQPPK